MFKPELEGSIRNMLVHVLMERGEVQNAKNEAVPVCGGGLGQVPEWYKKMELCK